MAATNPIRAFAGHGSAVLALICFVLIAEIAGQPLTGLADTGLSTLGVYHAIDQLGSYGQGAYQGLTDQTGYPYQSQMGYSSSGGQGLCSGSSGY